MSTLQLTGLFVTTATILVRLIRSGDHFPWYTRLLGIFKPSYPIQGTVEEGFEEVKEKFKENFDLGCEVGASVAVFSHGKKVVELYGGFKDFGKKTPYTQETLQLVYSSSKVMEAIAIARLVDKGYLKYEDKISSIWPEFGVKGKEDVTVEDLLRHEAGVTYFSDPQPAIEDLKDSEKRSKILAEQAHLWEGKKVRCYHAVSRGWYLNEISRRVHPLKRTLGEIYLEEINPLLNIEFYLGLSRENMPRRSTWYSVKTLDILSRIFLPGFILGPKASSKIRAEMFKKGNPFYNINKLRDPSKDFENGEDIHKDEMPSFNGFTNALSLAKVMACFANKGSFESSVLISEAGINNAISDCIEEYDTCLFFNTCMSRGGFGMFIFPECGENTRFYGWPGLGGSFTVFNPEYNFSFAYVMNGAGLTVLTGGRAKDLLVAAFKAHVEVYYNKQTLS
ncbi:hypothetical protein DSO57_1019650 [Entomophthora muscae]|uniref:Uncharacterized protein n=2 Tax=Entomophthora muscae TaxID=34485 RepID=A0ACC2UPN1_9FUNG|nr:hypothetical protein DSO57_1019650 [Entomophthora muscae]